MLDIFLSKIYPILLVIIFFCGSIIVHEFGHYIAARIRGLYVPRFSIGFGPRLFSKKIGETEFCISLFLFGGYVALPQLADLSEVEGKYELPDGAKQVSCADKIIVAMMGAVANIIFAIILSIIVWYTGIPVDGSSVSRTIGYIEHEMVLEDGTRIESPAHRAGLMIGDEILSIDDSSVENFTDIQQLLALGAHEDEDGCAYSTVRFLRDGKEMETVVYPLLLGDKFTVDKFRKIGILPEQKLVINSVINGIDAVQFGDQLLAIDDFPVLNIRFLQEYVADKDEVHVKFLRSGKELDKVLHTISVATIKPYLHFMLKEMSFDIIPYYAEKVDKTNISEHTEARLFLISDDVEFLKTYELDNDLELININGFTCTNLSDVLNYTKIGNHNIYTFLRSGMPISVELSPIDSMSIIPAVYKNILGLSFGNDAVLVHKCPIHLIGETVSTTFKTLYGLFNHHSDISIRNLMGPAGLIRTLHMCSKTDIRLLLWFVILINVNLAILNMLPLPVLDGGYVVFALLELVSHDRHKCIDRIFAFLQSIFLFLLLGLLIYVSFFDVKRWRTDYRMQNDYARQIKLRV